MAHSHLTLSDVLGFKIEENEPATCFFIRDTPKKTQCKHPLSIKTRREAHEILQRRVTFKNEEYDRIKEDIKTLAKLLIHGNQHNPTIYDAQRTGYEERWLDLWCTRAAEHRQKHGNGLVVIDYLKPHPSQEIVKFSEPEAIEDEPLESTLIPAITYTSPLLLQAAPASESTNTHLLPSPHTLQICDTPMPKNDDRVLDSSQTPITAESSALGVFMSPNQQMILQNIIQATGSTGGEECVKKESVFELDMLLRMRVSTSGLLNSLCGVVVVIGIIAFQVI